MDDSERSVGIDFTEVNIGSGMRFCGRQASYQGGRAICVGVLSVPSPVTEVPVFYLNLALMKLRATGGKGRWKRCDLVVAQTFQGIGVTAR